MTLYYAGLDLGQASDYSALAVVEETIYCPPAGGWVSWAELPYELRRAYKNGGEYEWRRTTTERPPLWLRQLYRYPLRTSYLDIVKDAKWRLNTASVLVLDATGVGAPVADEFRYANPPLPCEIVKVLIHGGTKVIFDRGLHVPKRDLIGAVQAVLQADRLKVAEASEDTATWLREMQNYQLKLTDSGHDTYNARGDSQHDDLVLAVALAVWLREYRNRGE